MSLSHHERLRVGNAPVNCRSPSVVKYIPCDGIPSFANSFTNVYFESYYMMII